VKRVKILSREVDVEFKVGLNAALAMDQAALTAGLDQMVALINSVAWPAQYAAAFEGMKKIVFFEGQVQVNTWLVDRPCCDEDDAVFYWEANEFMANTDADVHANTFFHDCWHVVQFKRNGNRYAKDEAERVAREVDAIEHQIEVARLLGCDEREIRFLEDFRDSQTRIIARLDEGVNGRMLHQPGTLSAGPIGVA
jgi:hypothetical protein